MKTITGSAAKKLGKFLTRDFRRMFGPAHNDVAERLGALARSTIECLGSSDALYHNFEHTYLVTMVGRDILQGMALAQRIEPSDYDHLIVACLLHDIGYMRGVLSGDTETEFVVDANGRKVTLPRGSSDAALSPYHVDRSKFRLRAARQFSNDQCRSHRDRDRIYTISATSAGKPHRVGHRAEAGAGCRFDRPARRSHVLAEG